MKQRWALIDAAKGLGMLLVVLGHAIQYNNLGFDNFWFRLIYSFHMPLFMFLSGCVAKYGNPRSITGNISRLVVPFLAWYVIAYFVRWMTSGVMPDAVHYALTLIRSVDSGLWFLWVLFLCHVFFYLLSQVQKWAGIIVTYLVFLLILVLPYSILGLGLFSYHFVYFVGGYLAFRYKDVLLQWRYYIVSIAIAIYLVLFPYWQFNKNDRLMNALPVFVKNHPLIVTRPFLIATAFSGIIIAIAVTWLLIQIPKIKDLLTLTGLYTMEIYVSHQLFFFALGQAAIVRVFSAFLIMLSASLVLAYLLKKGAFTRRVLYGIA